MAKKEGWHKLDYHQRGERIAALEAIMPALIMMLKQSQPPKHMLGAWADQYPYQKNRVLEKAQAALEKNDE